MTEDVHPKDQATSPKRKARASRSALFARFFLYSAILLALVAVVHFLVDRRTRPQPNYTLIEEGLYVGGLEPAPPPGVDAVLNLCEQQDSYEAEVHLWKPIRDAAPAPSLEWLKEMAGFVSAQRDAGRTVYVHCFAGVSRSGMVAVAHLMMKNGWTRDEALAYVRRKREIRPNPAFMELLLELENELRKS